MKRFCFLVVAVLGACTTASAGCGEIGVEALLWRLTRSDFAYVLSSDANGKATAVYNEPELEPGVRAYVGYQFQNCWSARLAYTYFYSEFSAQRGGSTQFPILQPVFASVFGTPLALATARIRDRHQTVDAEVAGLLCCGSRWSLEAFGGGRWVEMRTRENYHYEQVAALVFDVTQNSSFCGAGPRVGLHTTFYPCCNRPCFYLDGVFATSAIIASRSNFYNGSLPFFFSGDSQLALPSATVIIPAFDTRLGVNYQLCCGCMTWTLSVAYELQWYQNSRERLENAFNVGYPSSQVRGTGYAGLNFGVRAEF